MSWLVPTRELDFLLYDWLDSVALCDRAAFAEHDREGFEAIMDMARQIALDHYVACAAKLDANEPTFDGSQVHHIPEVKAALQAFSEAGFHAGTFPEELDGLGLPTSIFQGAMALFAGANTPIVAYSMLTMGAANLIATFGTEDQRTRYLPPMLEGRFMGTMCLSEPHAGSSLGDIRTRAEPREDGRFTLQGDKMWISGGDHDLSETIVHLVLARLPDAPPGTRGISLFVVPRDHVAADGTLSGRNGVRISGVNHKMGSRGTVNTVLHFDGAVGELLGEAHGGLRCMFQMMNEARVAVGLGASSLGYAGYATSLAYARERPQGRPLGERNAASPQVSILAHADVRRMLLAQKALCEGGLALSLYAARLVDDHRSHPDEAGRGEAGQLLDLLTPVVKAWPSAHCLRANDLAIQVLGGYGYSREYPVERFWRDNRLNPIHEGTNGIQALDLLGRKVPRGGGAAMMLLSGRVQATIARAQAHAELAPLAAQLAAALGRTGEVTGALLMVGGAGDVDQMLANASVYLDLFGHTVVAWLWLDMAEAALRTASGTDFAAGKLQACRYFFGWELPRTEAWGALLSRLDDTCLRMEPAWF